MTLPLRLTRDQFEKLYPVTRVLQRHSSEARSRLAASPCAGHVQRSAVGSYFYVHSLTPDVAYDTRGVARERAWQWYEGYSADEMRALRKGT